MSLAADVELRNLLISDAELTQMVNPENIIVGWTKAPTSYPCIVIVQVGGEDSASLGYATAPSGQRLWEERISWQINIFSDESRKQTLQIADRIREILFNADGIYYKTADVDTYEDSINAYRKIVTWTRVKFNED